ncbi:MAG: hypothetical protein V3W18_12945 [candidate division Zixibacteria bacterium]
MRKIGIIFILALIASLFALNFPAADENNITGSEELLQQGDAAFKGDNIDEALDIYLKAIQSALSEMNNSVLTEAYAQVARCYLRNSLKEEGRSWLEKAGEIASVDDPPGWSRYLGVRGRFEWKDAAELAGLLSPETDKASNTFKELYDYCLLNDLYERAIDAANMVSITARKDERIEWAKKGIEAAEKGNLEGWLAPLWNNLGWAYDDIGEYTESLKALEKARVYHYKRGKELPMLISDWSVGHALRMTGQIDSAETLLIKVQKWALILKSEQKTPETAEWFGFANLELGEIELLKGDNERALTLFKSAYSNLSTAGMRKWDPDRLKEIQQRMKALRSKKK